MIKHFTATAFVVQNNKIALHWHSKVCEWLPAGGHVEKNENPVQAAKREVKEEMGIDIRIISRSKYNFFEIDNIPSPEVILLESVFDKNIGKHQHIDFVYFAVPIENAVKLSNQWKWLDSNELLSQNKITNFNGLSKSPPEDVIKLGVDAIKKVQNI
ncbi:MAG: NUDIX domain-containing protein [Dehalococcoidia bacterium]|nr:NUDIX domain-containing protein [Dehalococcoidia bacterium]|tara:strand:- start:1096 stop:1566 length:471 start_codon:yes stop_codon:yes gene_type:complete